MPPLTTGPSAVADDAMRDLSLEREGLHADDPHEELRRLSL
ncbi:MAG: hypothetical protein U0790_11575 [Isosphaeraceae bacterium]